LDTRNEEESKHRQVMSRMLGEPPIEAWIRESRRHLRGLWDLRVLADYDNSKSVLKNDAALAVARAAKILD
jgi:hypothetical protein